PRRARRAAEPGGAAGPDRARPAPLARDHGPATDVAPAARGGRERRRGVSPGGGGGRLGRARRRPGRVVPAAHDGRRGAEPSDVSRTPVRERSCTGSTGSLRRRFPVAAKMATHWTQTGERVP